VRRAVLILVAVGLLAAAWILPASAQTSQQATALPGALEAPPAGAIQHLVVIVEENSTFDHVLGWLPTVNGHGTDQTVRSQIGQPKQLKMKGFSKLKQNAFQVNHGQEVLSNGPTAARQSYDNGAMDGFYQAQRAAGKNPNLSFTFIDPNANAPWGTLGEQGVVFDRYFSSAMAGSLPNTLNLVAGTTKGRDTGASADLRSLWHSHIHTIFDAANDSAIDPANQDAVVTWRYYVGGLGQIDGQKVADGEYAASTQATPSQLYWAPVLSMRRFWTDTAYSANIRTQNDFFPDAAAGDLPNITYILPQPTSHEPQVEGPDLRAMSVVNAIRMSPDWPSTAVVITWDDWGGYYDHVPPPAPSKTTDGTQLGFRVPMILLSPYVTGNQVSHQRLDHSSIPALAASLFGLQWRSPHTNRLSGVWTATPNTATQITSIQSEQPYAAAGYQHASSVFVLYLMTLVVITGVLFALGVTFRAARPGEGKRP
jgi:phospholipase C